ncbi:hypothetical protein EJ03DRAFT_352328 [Teratosphaeria nubilosa]|uniref:Uncharacterized protein n=1 Tax=Teratosphaeria nubilosa TaxID=161662 RepID=A0A6G1L7M3_9PEZI|nr:hypothetical protein EJ03DRAFT_352328 [Teratosphaeria nubilosa]
MDRFGLGWDVDRDQLHEAAAAALTAYHYLDHRNRALPERSRIRHSALGATQKGHLTAMAYMIPCISALSGDNYTAEQRRTWRGLVKRLGELMLQDDDFALATADAVRS